MSERATKIRRAVASEAAALTDLVMRSKAHWGYDVAFMEDCREELSLTPDEISSTDVWVGEADSVAGMYQLDHGASADVSKLFVEPDQMGKGLGKLLWTHLEQRARDQGAQSLVLDADPFAHPFYERMGMEVVGEAPSGSIPGRTLPAMEKHLG